MTAAAITAWKGHERDPVLTGWKLFGHGLPWALRNRRGRVLCPGSLPGKTEKGPHKKLLLGCFSFSELLSPALQGPSLVLHICVSSKKPVECPRLRSFKDTAKIPKASSL